MAGTPGSRSPQCRPPTPPEGCPESSALYRLLEAGYLTNVTRPDHAAGVAVTDLARLGASGLLGWRLAGFGRGVAKAARARPARSRAALRLRARAARRREGSSSGTSSIGTSAAPSASSAR